MNLPTWFHRLSFLEKRPALGFVLRYGLAVVITGLALLLTLHLPEIETHASFTFLIAGVAASAYLSGWKAGLLSTVLSALASAYMIVPPLHLLGGMDPADVLHFLGFILTSVLICGLIASLHSSRHALQTTQDALRLSKRRIEYVERHAKVWNWEYDLRTQRVSWSNLYGNNISRREQNYHDWLQMVLAEDRESVDQAVQSALQTGEFEARFRIMLGDSQPRWLLGRAQLVLLDGKPVALTGINMDLFLRAGSGAHNPEALSAKPTS